MAGAALERWRRAIERRKAEELALLARLDAALIWQPSEVVGGVETITALAEESIAAASELVAVAAPEAAEQALDDMVRPLLADGGGAVRLADGWESRADERVEFYLDQAAERLEEARDVFLNEVERQIEEAQAFGWSEETIAAILVEDMTPGGDRRQRGRSFGAFRSALRDAVASTVGEAWTATWLAAWTALEAAPRVIRRAETA